MQDDLHPVIGERLPHLSRVADRAEDGHQLDLHRLRQTAQLAVRGEERDLAHLVEDEPLRRAFDQLPTELRADGAAGPGDEDGLAGIGDRPFHQRGLHFVAPEQHLRLQRLKPVDQCLGADELREGGQRLHLEPHRLQPRGNSRLLRRTERRHREEDTVDALLLRDLGDAGRTVDGQPGDREALHRRLVVDESDRMDALVTAEGTNELGASRTGPIDQHACHVSAAPVDRQDDLQRDDAAEEHRQEQRDRESRIDDEGKRQADRTRQHVGGHGEADREQCAADRRAAVVFRERKRRQPEPDRQARGRHRQDRGRDDHGHARRRKADRQMHGPEGHRQREHDQDEVEDEEERVFVAPAQRAQQRLHARCPDIRKLGQNASLSARRRGPQSGFAMPSAFRRQRGRHGSADARRIWRRRCCPSGAYGRPGNAPHPRRIK